MELEADRRYLLFRQGGEDGFFYDLRDLGQACLVLGGLASIAADLVDPARRLLQELNLLLGCERVGVDLLLCVGDEDILEHGMLVVG